MSCSICRSASCNRSSGCIDQNGCCAPDCYPRCSKLSGPARRGYYSRSQKICTTRFTFALVRTSSRRTYKFECVCTTEAANCTCADSSIASSSQRHDDSFPHCCLVRKLERILASFRLHWFWPYPRKRLLTVPFPGAMANCVAIQPCHASSQILHAVGVYFGKPLAHSLHSSYTAT